MPIEYEMMYLVQTTENAISRFSEDNFASTWSVGIEDKVFDIMENDSNAAQHFTEYQMRAMRELIRRGYWVKWSDNVLNSRVMLYRIARPHKEGAD